MPIIHSVVKSAGEKLRAILDWNAPHAVTLPLDLSGLYIAVAGNVGIGTTEPVGLLDVKGGVVAGLQGTDANLPYVGFGTYWDGSKLRSIGSANYAMGIATTRTGLGATSRLDLGSYIDSGVYCTGLSVLANGNVGIGTTSPTSALQVVGLPVYANNAAAVAGGLTAGAFYRTGADPDPVCVVH